MIISKTPFRISFAGGGTDFADFYKIDGGAVVSTAIDKFMYIIVNRRYDDTIRASYSVTEIADNPNQIKHPIIREALKLVGIDGGIEIISIADIPAGTGLGSSSSFTVGLLNALYAFQGTYKTAEELAQEACRLEIGILREPIGKQDQYIAAYGGFRYIKFNPDGSVDVESIQPDGLCDRLMLFDTGSTREANSILRTQKENIPGRLDTLRALRDMAIWARIIIDEGSDGLGGILEDGWKLKCKLADRITNMDIDKIYLNALNAGALGGKLLGAGGGGFMLLYCHENKQYKVMNALAPLRRVHFGFEGEGTKIIRDYKLE